MFKQHDTFKVSIFAGFSADVKRDLKQYRNQPTGSTQKVFLFIFLLTKLGIFLPLLTFFFHVHRKSAFRHHFHH